MESSLQMALGHDLLCLFIGTEMGLGMGKAKQWPAIVNRVI